MCCEVVESASCEVNTNCCRDGRARNGLPFGGRIRANGKHLTSVDSNRRDQIEDGESFSVVVNSYHRTTLRSQRNGISPVSASSITTGPLRREAIWFANLIGVFDGENGRCAVAVFKRKKRAVCDRCSGFLQRQRSLRSFPFRDNRRIRACIHFSNH